MRNLVHDRDRTIHDGSVSQVRHPLRAHHVLCEHDAPGTFHRGIADHWTQNQIQLAKRVRLPENHLVKVNSRLTNLETQICAVRVCLAAPC